MFSIVAQKSHKIHFEPARPGIRPTLCIRLSAFFLYVCARSRDVLHMYIIYIYAKYHTYNCNIFSSTRPPLYGNRFFRHVCVLSSARLAHLLSISSPGLKQFDDCARANIRRIIVQIARNEFFRAVLERNNVRIYMRETFRERYKRSDS